MPRSRKILITVLCAALAVACAIGGTLAYLWDDAPPDSTEFVPVFVDCLVEGDTLDANHKTNVTVRNTGDTSAYVRAAIIVNYVKADGSVYAHAPTLGVDYTLTAGSTDWLYDGAAFYYYKYAVSPDGSTAELFDEIVGIKEPPEGCTLSVTVLASAIQSEPDAAVKSSWGINLINGEISLD